MATGLKDLDGVQMSDEAVAADLAKQAEANAKMEAEIASKMQARIDDALWPEQVTNLQKGFDEVQARAKAVRSVPEKKATPPPTTKKSPWAWLTGK